MWRLIGRLAVAAWLVCNGGHPAHAGGCTSWVTNRGYWYWAKHDLHGTLVEVYGNHENAAGGIVSPELVVVAPGQLAAARENLSGLRALRAKDYRTAQAHLRASLQHDPDHSLANYNMACVLALSGRPFADGKPFLEKAVKGQPRTMIRQIKTDKDLSAWRGDRRFADWLRETQRGTRRSK